MNFVRQSQEFRPQKWDALFSRAAAATLSGNGHLPVRRHDTSEEGRNFVHNRAQNRYPSDECQPGHQSSLIQSLSKNLLRSLLASLPQQQQQQIIRNQMGHFFNIQNLSPSMSEANNPVVQVAVKSKTKQQRSRKKRRKNNTGFYYGIREDVLILPERSLADRGQKKITKPSNEHNSKGGASDERVHEHVNTNVDDNLNEIPIEQTPPDTSQLPTAPSEEKRKKSTKTQSLLPPRQDEAITKKNKKMLGKKAEPSKSIDTELKTAVFDETLQELRSMKDEIIALREELRSLKGQLHEQETSTLILDEGKLDEKTKWWARPSPKEPFSETPDVIIADTEEESIPLPLEQEEIKEPKVSPRMRRREFERIGQNVEAWACRLLFDQEDKEDDGWKEIECNKFCRKKFNPDGRTQVYLKVSQQAK
jgi:DNA polymerase III gamma/tau subunit